MADKPKAPKKTKGLGDEFAEGVVTARHPGYAAYRREAIAMGDDVLSPQEWAAKQDREKDD